MTAENGDGKASKATPDDGTKQEALAAVNNPTAAEPAARATTDAVAVPPPSKTPETGGHQLKPPSAEVSIDLAERDSSSAKAHSAAQHQERGFLKYVEAAAFAVSVVALFVSIFVGLEDSSHHRDDAERDVIGHEYDTFLEINKLQIENPALAHMFAMPDSYEKARKLSESIAKNSTKQEVALLRARENGIALYIFTMFERTLYERETARNAHDEERAQFLDAVVNYFTGRLLRNQRLLWFWSPTGGAMASYFEKKPTREVYDALVLKGRPAVPVANPQMDIAGPFAETVSQSDEAPASNPPTSGEQRH